MATTDPTHVAPECPVHGNDSDRPEVSGDVVELQSRATQEPRTA
jgi:hypothetical protein